MRPVPRAYRLIAALMAIGFLSGCGDSGSFPDAYIEGRSAYGSICSACHGNAGQGGVGPEMSQVLETFPSCDDQIHWITLGSDRWLDEVGPTYGEPARPVEGGMAPIGDQLSPEEIAAVAMYERVRFGGLEIEEASRQCGISLAESGQN